MTLTTYVMDAVFLNLYNYHKKLLCDYIQGASSKSGQISIKISLHIVPPPNVTLGD